jgi:succinate dehydrogenase / fumarate reductase, cytochrome b subunit
LFGLNKLNLPFLSSKQIKLVFLRFFFPANFSKTKLLIKMQWLLKFFNSSIGSKLIMSLTGLFLCSFLLIHMAGNLQLFANDGGKSFNAYAYFMTHNPLIKTVSYGLYAMILVHAIKGLLLWFYNSGAKGTKYAKPKHSDTRFAFASYNMATLGIIVFAFIGLHMAQFWGKMHFSSDMPTMVIEGFKEPVKDLYKLVADTFAHAWVVVVYLISLLALSLHLLHGFASGFQTLGFNHKKYTPLIHALGTGFAILIPLGFAAMPLFFFAKSMM